MKDEIEGLFRRWGDGSTGADHGLLCLIRVLAGHFLDSKPGHLALAVGAVFSGYGAAAMKVMYDLVIKEEMK